MLRSRPRSVVGPQERRWCVHASRSAENCCCAGAGEEEAPGIDPFTKVEREFAAKPATVKLKVRSLKKLKDAAL